MKQTMKYLSMAALVVMGAIVASCAKEEPAQPEEITPEVVEPVAEDNIVVCTTTVSFDNSADTDETKALDEDGVKTFAIGEMIAVIYKNDSDQTVKAVSAALEAEDIASGDKSATFHLTLVNPGTDAAVRIIYPAAMAASTVATNVAVDADATINYAALNTQDGTLATLSSNLDLAVYDGTLSGTSLPADPALKNKLAICAFTLKDNAEPAAEITSTITSLTINDGTNNYNVTRSAAAGPIYVAIRPTSDATMNYMAYSSAKNYSKTTTTKTYEAGHLYPLGLRMAEATILDLSTVSANTTAANGTTIINSLDDQYKISIADGATVILDNAWINSGWAWSTSGYAGITCLGDATIILKNLNQVNSLDYRHPGIYVPEGKTLTIQGSGRLIVYAAENGGNSGGAAIGGGQNLSCGNIVINGGLIEASALFYAAGIGSGYAQSGAVTCGTITINGGTVKAKGGMHGAGIGTGKAEGGTNSCGAIIINGGMVEAEGGQYGAGIGSGYQSSSNANTCASISVASNVTSVVGKKSGSEDWANSISRGWNSSCGTVTIGGTVYWDGTNYQNGGDAYLSDNSCEYPASADETIATTSGSGAYVFDGTNVTISCSQVYNGTGVNIGNNNTLTISTKNGKTITKVEFTCSNSDWWTSSTTVSQGIRDWEQWAPTGYINMVNSTSVTMSNTMSTDVIITQVKVYYTPAP